MNRKLTLLKICGLILWNYCANAQTKFESLNFIYSIQGKQILSGQHNDQKNLECGYSGATNENYWTEQVRSITGKYPALYSGDFLFNDDINARWAITYEAERQWNAGAVVQMMWHSCPPTGGSVCGWNPGVIGSLNAQQWAELLTDGSALNQTWKARVDQVAIHLQYLKDKGVEVFWRPYHEQNQTVFWWNSGGAGNTKALWRMMHDYMTKVKGLDNLIWIWDVQDISGATNYWDWNPGNQYWDILALDIYADAYTNSEYYNNMLTAAGGKPIAIGECFTLPSAASIDKYPQFTFFMNWSYGLKYGLSCEQTNTDTYIQQVYNNPKVITRDEMPGWGKNKVPANLAKGKPVVVSSTETGLNVAGNVTDGSYLTRWSSLYSDNQWMYVDLQDEYLINQVKITWETAMAKNYFLEVSSDGVNWTNISTVTNNAIAVNDFTGLNAKARYVRMYGTSRVTIYGFSIYEIEVYGKGIPKPFSGTPVAIPGIIEAENYDLGGEGVAYHDLNTTNGSGQYRTDGVDIENCTDAGNGYNLADVQTGEWTNYTINVTETAEYEIKLRLATTQLNKTFHIEIDEVNVSGVINVPTTGGWQNWQTVTLPKLVLTKGIKNLKVVMDSDLFNLNYIKIDPPVITSVLENELANQVILYPNPTNQLLNYVLPNELIEENKIEIFNTQGKLVWSKQHAEISGSIELGALEQGMYIIRIAAANDSVLKTFIKVK
jgi:hypothetical protein